MSKKYNFIMFVGASRQTFYNHFSDKYDLINWIYANDHQKVLSLYGTEKNWRETLYLSYLVFWEHKKFYIAASKCIGPNSFLSYLWEFCNEFYEKSIIERYGEEEVTDELRFSIRFNNFGAVNMFNRWLMGGLKYTPKEMANLLVDNMPENMKKYFD